MVAKKRKKISKNSDAPLTLGGLVDYTHGVLLPALDKQFAAKGEFKEFKDEMSDFKREMYEFKDEMSDFKREMYEFKDEMSDFKREFEEFKNESLTGQDTILKKLDILLEEKQVADFQYEKQKRFFLIITKALKDHKILNQIQLKQIAKLEIL